MGRRSPCTSDLRVVWIVHGREPVGHMDVKPCSAVEERVSEPLILRPVHEEGSIGVVQLVCGVNRVGRYGEQHDDGRGEGPQNREWQPIRAKNAGMRCRVCDLARLMVVVAAVPLANVGALVRSVAVLCMTPLYLRDTRG